MLASGAFHVNRHLDSLASRTMFGSSFLALVTRLSAAATGRLPLLPNENLLQDLTEKKPGALMLRTVEEFGW